MKGAPRAGPTAGDLMRHECVRLKHFSCFASSQISWWWVYNEECSANSDRSSACETMMNIIYLLSILACLLFRENLGILFPSTPNTMQHIACHLSLRKYGKYEAVTIHSLLGCLLPHISPGRTVRSLYAVVEAIEVVRLGEKEYGCLLWKFSVSYQGSNGIDSIWVVDVMPLERYTHYKGDVNLHCCRHKFDIRDWLDRVSPTAQWELQCSFFLGKMEIDIHDNLFKYYIIASCQQFIHFHRTPIRAALFHGNDMLFSYATTLLLLYKINLCSCNIAFWETNSRQTWYSIRKLGIWINKK